MPQEIKLICTCDDNCDDPCPAHARENLLQDDVVRLRNELETQQLAYNHDIEVLEDKIKGLENRRPTRLVPHLTEKDVMEMRRLSMRDKDMTEKGLERFRELETAYLDAMIEIGELKGWVDDLQSGMYINCVYCGHRYGPKSDTPTSMADVLKEHVENCPKHPMSALKAELLRTQQELKRLQETTEK